MIWAQWRLVVLVYSAGFNGAALLASAAILGIMYTMNKAGVKSLPLYLLMSAFLWYAVLLSGVHATIAGVLAASGDSDRHDTRCPRC